jgi:hypothetical protein
MFRALRERWGGARGRRLAGLFAFEFVVVVLGVLTAQAVQSWAQERDRYRRAKDERVRLEQGFLASQDMAAVWRSALPCLRERVKDIMLVASAGGSLPAEMARRPKLVQNYYAPVSPEHYLLIAAQIGEEKAGVLTDVQGRFETIQNAAHDMRTQWELFRLLDPAYGQASLADRAAARVAGASILTSMRTIEIALDQVEAQKGLIVAKRKEPFDRAFGVLPVRTCAEVWAKGTAYRLLDPGEKPPY